MPDATKPPQFHRQNSNREHCPNAFAPQYLLVLFNFLFLRNRTVVIQDICRQENVSEVTFHRWKKQLGHMEINEARRLKELERENGELKKMLAESPLKNRVLEAVCEKKL